MKKMTIVTLLLAAALCSACGNTDSSVSAPVPDTVTTTAPTPADEEPAITVKLEGEENADPDEKAETDSDTAPEEIADITDDRKS
ncbi:MAG: hypothetical protein IJ561_05045, partial [Ruminococcus sp.]|nr:hypothetical protein [Ruminococcus sp.]